MAERREISPLSQEVKNHLRTIYLQGPIRRTDPLHGADHGTSLETLKLLIDTGIIIGYSRGLPLGHYRQGTLSVYPLPQLADKIGHLTDPSIQQILERYPSYAINSAKTYARRIAQRHAFSSTMGYNLNGNDSIFLNKYERERLVASYPKSGRDSQEVLRAAFKAGDSRHGFLLAISPEVANTPGMTLGPGDNGSSDISIDTNEKGLPYLLLSGIEPLGPVEAEFLQSLA